MAPVIRADHGGAPQTCMRPCRHWRYAPTPPFEGVKLPLTFVATGEYARRTNNRQRSQKSEGVGLIHIDAHRAYANANVDKDILLDLPPKATREVGGKQRGKLSKTLCGPRHSAIAWKSEVHKAIADVVMEAGAYS